jgi:prolyl-tRNA editing enzyme YbaK/EbsC (Cys-tRNA(Pro) deacylase)
VGNYTVGSLTTVPVAERPDLVPAHVLAAVAASGFPDRIGVVEIDPELSDTAATQDAYDLPLEVLANCVIVSGKREGVERIAACLVPATTRIDINTVVRKRLDVRKASFLPREQAVESTGMEFGGITPVGLPTEWPLLVDASIAALPLILIGSGIRASKLILPGELAAQLPNAELVEALGRPIQAEG